MWQLAILVALTSCGRVVVEDEAEVDATAAAPSSADASGVGGSGANGGAGGADAGTAPSTGVTDPGDGGGGSGVGGDAPAPARCDALAWADGAFRRGGYPLGSIQDLVLHDGPTAGDVILAWAHDNWDASELTVVHRVETSAWTGPVDWEWDDEQSGNYNDGFPGPVPQPAVLGVAPAGETAYAVARVEGGVDLYREREYVRSLPAEWGRVLALRQIDWDMAVVRAAGGRLDLRLLREHDQDDRLGDLGCVGGEPRVDLVRTANGSVVVAAAVLPPEICPAEPTTLPTSVSIVVVRDGRATTSTIDVGAPIDDVQLAPHPDGSAILALRTDARTRLRTFRIGDASDPEPLLELETSSERGVAVAVLGGDLVVVDSGHPTHGTSLRVRVLDPAGETIAEALAPEELAERRFSGRPVLAAAPDGSSLYVASVGGGSHTGEWVNLARVDCAAAGR